MKIRTAFAILPLVFTACATPPLGPTVTESPSATLPKLGDEIARWQERLGVNHFIMRVQWPGLEQEKVLNSIRRLGEIFA